MFALIFALTTASAIGSATLATQADPLDSRISCSFTNRDIKQAITAELGAASIPCRFESGITGKITFATSNEKLRDALQEILVLHGLTCRFEEGAVRILKSQSPGGKYKFSVASDGQISLECSGPVDARVVLEEYIKLVRSMYSVSLEIDASVHGVISSGFKATQFETNLQRLLEPIGATYRISGGIYEIVMRDREDEDPAYHFAFSNSGRVDHLEVTNAPLRPFVNQLMRRSHKDFTIGPEVGGVVSTEIKQAGLGDLLQNVLEQTGNKLLVEDGIYNFSRA